VSKKVGKEQEKRFTPGKLVSTWKKMTKGRAGGGRKKGKKKQGTNEADSGQRSQAQQGYGKKKHSFKPLVTVARDCRVEGCKKKWNEKP